MTEKTLKHLTLDGLFDLLLNSSKELLEAIDKKDEIGIKVKKKKLELLQELIDAKKIELNPILKK